MKHHGGTSQNLIWFRYKSGKNTVKSHDMELRDSNNTSMLKKTQVLWENMLTPKDTEGAVCFAIKKRNIKVLLTHTIAMLA